MSRVVVESIDWFAEVSVFNSVHFNTSLRPAIRPLCVRFGPESAHGMTK